MTGAESSKPIKYAKLIWERIRFPVRVLGLPIGLMLLMSVVFSMTPAGQQLSEDLSTEIVVEETVLVEGDDVVAEVTYGSPVTVELSGTASDFGIAHLYLYEDGDRIGKQQLGPLETKATFNEFVSNDSVESWTLVAVDGSNNVVSQVEIRFDTVKINQ